MQFANPAMLLGLLLLAIPILIYFMNRRRFREVPWAAISFLEAALKKNRRRLAFESFLLLALRLGIILFLVLAMARPYLEEGTLVSQVGRARRDLVILLDRSFSMGYRSGTELSNLDRGLEAIGEILDKHAQAGDQVRVYLLDEGVESRFPHPVTMDASARDLILSDLLDLEPSHYGTDISRGLRTVMDSFGKEGPDEIAKEIFLITDMQRVSWAVEGRLLDPSLPRRIEDFRNRNGVIHILDVGTGRGDNLAVESLTPSDPIIGPGMPVRLDAIVRSHSASDQPQVEVALVVDGRVTRRLTQDVPAGDQSLFQFHHVFEKGGSHSVTARLATDRLALDDERHLALDIQEGIPVLIVDGDIQEEVWESESDFLRVALAPSPGDAPAERRIVDVTVISPGDLGNESLGAYSVVILANVAALGDHHVDALEAYVGGGGGLLVSLGNLIDDVEFYPESFYKGGQGLLPAAPGPVVGDQGEEPMQIARVEVDHPALRFFAPKGRKAVLTEDPYFSKIHECPDRPAETTVLLSVGREGTDLEIPLLLEKRFGRGTVMLWTSTLDDEWTTMYRSWTYVALMQLLTYYLADAESVRSNLLVGDPYVEIVPGEAYSDRVTLIQPSREEIPKPLTPESDGSGNFRIAHDACDEAGIYTILYGQESGESREEYFAVNLRTEESDLRAIAHEEVKDLLPEGPVRIFLAEDLSALTGESPDGTGSVGFWKPLLTALLLLIAVETLLARFLSR